VLAQVANNMLQEGHIENGNQSLGCVAGKGLQPGAFTAYQDYCFHGTLDFTIIYRISINPIPLYPRSPKQGKGEDIS